MTSSHPRLALAREWASAVQATAFLPMSNDEVQRLLLDQVDAIVDRLAGGEDPSKAAAAAGAVLVGVHCTGERSLSRSVEVLGLGLLRLPELAGADELAVRVITALGGLGAGYADALRRKTFDQQEDVKQALERVLRLSEARFREVFTASAVGIAISDLDGALVQTNKALAEILGYEHHELARGNLFDLFGGAGQAGTTDHLRLAYRDIVSRRQDHFRIERPLLRKEGDQAWVFLAVSALRDESGAPTHHVTMVEDITDLHLLQVQLNNQALHDVLTGLPNRQSFALKLESFLGQLDPAAVVTLFHLDVDGFAVINDGIGHEVGDLLLRLVARRLQLVFADEQAIIARVAGDEFTVLFANSPSTPDVATLAARINEELAEPAYHDGVGLAVSASLGVVQRPAGGVTPAELLRQADTTLRRAKLHGKRQWALFDAVEDARNRERFTRAAGMPGALESGEFRLSFQPLVRLADHQVMAIDTLVSWDHPERGTLDNDEVSALAEQTGMALPIGEWTLRAACAQAARWYAEFGERMPPLAVNLSTPQANDPDLVATLNHVLHDSGLPPRRVHVGLPIRALLCEEGDAEDNLQVLADMGVFTTIHGFGGGHGGLVFLEDLPVRAVRIARWLVDRLAERPESVTGRALADLISLVHTFDAMVIVAGVRTEEQAQWWHQINADTGCGELFAPAAPAETITQWLRGGTGY